MYETSPSQLDQFNYVYSCDLHENIQLKIGSLEGSRWKTDVWQVIKNPLLRYSGPFTEGVSDLFVTAEVVSNDVSLCPPVKTSYKAFVSRWNWNEWLTLGVRFSDLTRNSVLLLTVWDCLVAGEYKIVAGTSISLFGKYGAFRQGIQDLRLWRDMQASLETPGKGKTDNSLTKLSKKHQSGQLESVDWLDRLTFREVTQINERQKRVSNHMYLMIQFPKVHYNNIIYNVVYFEEGGETSLGVAASNLLVKIPDPEIGQENLVESKHHRLARALQAVESGSSEFDLKPNSECKARLAIIVSYPPTKHLSSEEMDLVWRFRNYLVTQNKALNKFIKCVDWSVEMETAEAERLIAKWQPPEVSDALELLSPQFTTRFVRKYAVSRLKDASNEELLMYLLQLVQALKYEADEDSIDNAVDETGAGLVEFLIERACADTELASYFFWYLTAETEDIAKGTPTPFIYNHIYKVFDERLMGCNKLMYLKSVLLKQKTFVDSLVYIVKTVQKEPGNRIKKIEKFRTMLADTEHSAMNFLLMDPMPLPLDPNVFVTGIDIAQATLFKSALRPCRLVFHTTEQTTYTAIFKLGDDLRQDQLILQIISLMDRLLRKENLDLKLNPYKVLATSSNHGFVQFIESKSVGDIISSDGSILNFLRENCPCDNSPFGVHKDAMNNYVRSCAGYSVITFILGVGDRHHDNLLLKKSGELFHIDFGYILGRDPKPLPPPMKLSKEIIEGMGGEGSDYFKEFKRLCYTSFLHLRRHANLILNLFSLMIDANVPDIALEPDKTVKKVQDRLFLNLSDEEAVIQIQNCIDVSIASSFAAVMEQMHKLAQFMRK